MTEGRTTRIIGHLVTRNEMNRYLKVSLAWLQELTDGIIVALDDQSTDGTYEYLKGAGVQVRRRHRDVPAFAQDESAFRGAAWRAMEALACPRPNDWILCMDADEFLVHENYEASVRDELTDAVERASSEGIAAVSFDVAEVFDIDQGFPLVRTDGFWGSIRACRLVRYRGGGEFQDAVEGGGSVPTDWIDWRFSSSTLRILHFGYARETDRRARYERYNAGRGHNPAHIRSIIAPPSLRPWAGSLPRWYETGPVRL